MSNFMKVSSENAPRVELHEKLGLTGAERQFFATKDNSISYICIQVKENSLEKFTANDAIII